MARSENFLSASRYNFSYQPREIVGSRAFNLEYQIGTTDNELRDDIISYLGEYRLRVQKYNYTLIYGIDEEGEIGIRDLHRGELMRVKAKRAIIERRLCGLPTHREEAEEEGIIALEAQLKNARNSDSIIWASPPGPKDQGYGDYGFVYAGKVLVREDGSLQLVMTAIRVEYPSIQQFNQAMSVLTGKQYRFENADDFLRAPALVASHYDSLFVDRVIQECFLFQQKDNTEMFRWVIAKLARSIDEFIFLARTAEREEKLKAFYALENLALKLKEEYVQGIDLRQANYPVEKPIVLADLVETYGYKPPAAFGSCGGTAEKSNNIFNLNLSKLMNVIGFHGQDYEFDQPGPCRICGEDVPCGPCKICAACDLAIREKENKADILLKPYFKISRLNSSA